MTLGSAWPRALAPLALMGVIFYLSAQPPAADVSPWASAVAHFTEYFLLALLWIWALTPGLGAAAIPVAAAISLIYAVSDEYHQRFVEGRDSDPLDVLTDAAGIAAACLLAQARGRASTRATHSSSRG